MLNFLRRALAGALIALVSVAAHAGPPTALGGASRSQVIDLAGAKPPLIQFVGDSVNAATTSQNTSLLTMISARGHQFHIPFLTDKRIKSRPDLNFAVSGRTTADVLANIAGPLASDAAYTLLQAGTNDPGVLSLAQSKANFTEIVTRLTAAGKIVLWLPPLPRDLSTASTRDQLWQMIRWVEDQRHAGWRNVYVFATAARYVNPTSSTSAPKTGYAYDGLHPTYRGDHYTAQDVVAWIKSVLPSAGSIFSNVASIYSANDNPRGNLLTNGLFTGTSGTSVNLIGALAGSVPTGWNAQHSANGGTLSSQTTTFTAITHPVDGRPGIRIAFSGSYTGAGSSPLNASTAFIFQQTFSSFTNFSIGDVLRGRVEIIKNAAATENLTGLEWQCNFTMGGSLYRIADGSSYGDPLPVEAYSGTLETPTITLTAVPTTAACGLRAYFANGAQTMGSSVDVYGGALEKVQ